MEQNFTDLITICIPVWERYEYFVTAINSAINQTVRCPIIVTDNASSHDKFKKFVLDKGDPTISYNRNPANIGVNNWNKCFELCKTSWCSILHDDDYLDPRFIEFSLNKIALNPGIAALAVGCRVGTSINPSEFTCIPDEKGTIFTSASILYTSLTPAPGVVFRCKTARALKGFHEIDYCADLDFWYRLAKSGIVLKYESVLSFYRISENSGNLSQLTVNSSYDYRKGIAKGFIQKHLVKRATLSLLGSYAKAHKKKLKAPFSLVYFQLVESGIKFLKFFGRFFKYNPRIKDFMN